MKHSGTIRKVLSLVRKLRPGHITLIVITKLISTFRTFLPIVYGSRILDMLLQKCGFEEVMQTALEMLVLEGVFGLIHWGMEKLVGINQRALSIKIQQIICEKTLDIDYDILEKKETLELISKAENGMTSHGDITHFCNNLARFIENICSAVYALVLLIPLFVPTAYQGTDRLAILLNRGYSVLFLIAVAGLCLCGTTMVNKRRAKAQQDSFEQIVTSNRFFSYFYSMVFDYAQGKYIRLYKLQPLITTESDKCAASMEAEARRLTRKLIKTDFVHSICSFFLQYSSYLYVGLKAVYSLISVGNTLRYISAYANLAGSIGMLFDVYINIDIQSKYLAYFYDYMEIENKRYEGTLPIEKRDDNEFVIEFKDVSFRYPNTDEYVLSHVNTKISLGSKTAVVGPNGAGKTTFIKLLCRLYDPTEGEILLNGINIQLYDYEEYVGLLSVVFQDFKLFSGSLAENVAGTATYDADVVRNCLLRAGFEKRLADMPQGIQTNIYQMEENGIEISGGEAQKIAIARALYKDVPYVILDEPTSALDPVSEYEIYRHFDELVKDKTSIYISHRMSSCRFCDTIYVFDEGRIVQSGSHDTLMQESEGLYHQMWTAQAQYYTA